jgi:DNA-binding NtrC family response regulator
MTAPMISANRRPVVLIVDDEAEIREVLRLGLEASFEVELARSANEAELMMATREFDVVVSDHLMPDEEGLAFLIRAQRQFPRTQRVLMTGYINPELLSRSTALAGLSAVLLKPVATADLAAAIRSAVK